MQLPASSASPSIGPRASVPPGRAFSGDGEPAEPPLSLGCVEFANYACGVFSTDTILDVCAAALQREERRRTDEHSPFGIERLDEVELHPIVAAALCADGLGVLREQGYPGEWRGRKGRRKPLPEQTERRRCDLVLTTAPNLALADRLVEARVAHAAAAQAVGTLFEPLVCDTTADASTAAQATAAGSVAPDQAFWLEIKATGQFVYESGVPGPNGTYGSQLMRACRSDLGKLAADPDILHAGLLLILFAADERVATHDVGIIASRLADSGLLACVPEHRTIEVPDRIGNTVCHLAMLTPPRTRA